MNPLLAQALLTRCRFVTYYISAQSDLTILALSSLFFRFTKPVAKGNILPTGALHNWRLFVIDARSGYLHPAVFVTPQ
jgi:hypothetical protein